MHYPPFSGRRRGVLAATLVGATLAAAGCAGSAPSAGGAKGAHTIVIGVGQEPDSLSPILGYSKDGAAKLFDGLLAHDADLGLVPALARALPEVSADGLTYTYRLRDRLSFSDGRPLTSADVAFTYRTILDPTVPTTVRSDLAALDRVAAPDPGTVVFTLKYPYAPFPQRTTLGIVPEHALGTLTGPALTTAEFNRKPIGSGPYTVDTWRAGEKLVLKANPNYWGGEPAIKQVTFAFILDDNTRATRLAAGDLDAAALPPKLAERFAKDRTRSTLKVDTADYRGVMLPSGNPVTGDLAVRKALDLAVDRGAMVRGILNGDGAPAFGPVAPSSPLYARELEHAVDAPAAERLLDEAGWRKGDGGIRVKDGRAARFTLLYPAGDALRKDLALAYVSDAKRIGIDISVEGLTWDAIEPRMRADALLMGQGAPYDPDFVSYETFHSSLAGQAFNNPGHYRNASVDALLTEGRTTRDPARRAQVYGDLQRALAADPAWTFLTYLKHVYVVDNDWTGVGGQVEPHPHDLVGPWWNIEKWVPRAASATTS
ncbi:ABC transporter substrate-binding protein [Embleya sp. NPDC020886]|uniref:ABC transporter substrate-binding protein n=1 Tax=Embleya sp. NPDC020886 TaxID=3363980 RepID=UPI0037AE8C0C